MKGTTVVVYGSDTDETDDMYMVLDEISTFFHSDY